MEQLEYIDRARQGIVSVGMFSQLPCSFEKPDIEEGDCYICPRYASDSTTGYPILLKAERVFGYPGNWRLIAEKECRAGQSQIAVDICYKLEKQER